MISPFVALRDLGWTFAYDKKIGVTSAFGHVIDHVATNKPLEVESAEIRYLTNQKFGNKPPDTDLVITDHNAVQARGDLRTSGSLGSGAPHHPTSAGPDVTRIGLDLANFWADSARKSGGSYRPTVRRRSPSSLGSIRYHVGFVEYHKKVTSWGGREGASRGE